MLHLNAIPTPIRRKKVAFVYFGRIPYFDPMEQRPRRLVPSKADAWAASSRCCRAQRRPVVLGPGISRMARQQRGTARGEKAARDICRVPPIVAGKLSFLAIP